MKKLYLILITITQLFSPALFATDGVVEINQTCAVELGCFTSDTPGFPVSINGDAGNNYRLTSDLILPDINTGGIIITTDFITIDLNGFSIYRSGCLLNCTATLGTAHGIFASDSFPAFKIGTTVKNGNIVGMGLTGVSLSRRANVQNINVSNNGSAGVSVGSLSRVMNSNSAKNLGDGIVSDDGCILNNNISTDNDTGGINAGFACVISNNLVYNNNGDYGISVDPSSNVFNNVVRRNGDYSLKFISGASSYRANTLSNYDTAAIFSEAGGSGINMGNNLCNSAICPL